MTRVTNEQATQELEQKLDPGRFVRVHRATLVNVAHVHELHSWFAGRMMVRLKDAKHTELTVSRDRVRALKFSLSARFSPKLPTLRFSVGVCKRLILNCFQKSTSAL